MSTPDPKLLIALNPRLSSSGIAVRKMNPINQDLFERELVATIALVEAAREVFFP